MKLLLQFMLNVIDLLVNILNISIHSNFSMKRDHNPSRTIVVNNQVMNSIDQRMSKYDFFDLIDKFLLRRLAQKKIDGFFQCGTACIDNK